jgi:PAS domain S-box-containing protein
VPEQPSPPIRAEDVLESISDAFYAVDADWRYVVFNRAAEAFFDVSRSEVLGREMWEVFPQGRGTEFERACEAARLAEQSPPSKPGPRCGTAV